MTIKSLYDELWLSHEELVAREGSAYRRLVEVETAQSARGAAL